MEAVKTRQDLDPDVPQSLRPELLTPAPTAPMSAPALMSHRAVQKQRAAEARANGNNTNLSAGHPDLQ